MLPSFSDIRYFMEVASTGNISRAAERLGITQPSLSSSVQRLEKATASTLLVRNRSGVTLTKSGQELARQGRLLLLQWEQMAAGIQKQEATASGRYVIGAHPSVALYALPEFLPGLLGKYPGLEISLVHDLSRKITEKVISFEIDFGIVVNPVRHPDLVISELCRDEVSLWCAKKPSSSQVMDAQKGILLCDTELAQTQKLLGDLQKQKKGFARVIQSGSLELITELTAAGVGVGILPGRVVARHHSKSLKLLDPSLPQCQDRIALVYRADFQKTAGARVITKAITDAFRD